jgi:hypothetical protein
MLYRLPAPGLKALGAHRGNIIPYNTDGIAVEDSSKAIRDLSDNPPFDIAYLAHYWCKTPQEFKNKVDRGRANSPLWKKRSYDEYKNGNFNEVEDLTVYNFMYGNIYE